MYSVTKQKKIKGKTVDYICEQCNVGLCLVPCFEIYYTQEKYF